MVSSALLSRSVSGLTSDSRKLRPGRPIIKLSSRRHGIRKYQCFFYRIFQSVWLVIEHAYRDGALQCASKTLLHHFLRLQGCRGLVVLLVFLCTEHRRAYDARWCRVVPFIPILTLLITRPVSVYVPVYDRLARCPSGTPYFPPCPLLVFDDVRQGHS